MHAQIVSRPHDELKTTDHEGDTNKPDDGELREWQWLKGLLYYIPL